MKNESATNKFVEQYFQLKKIVHYDLPDSLYYKLDYSKYLSQIGQQILTINISIAGWSILYALTSEGFYVIATSILLAAVGLKVNPNKIFVGLVGAIPLIYVEFLPYLDQLQEVLLNVIK